MIAAEFVQPPEDGAYSVERSGRVRFAGRAGGAAIAEEPEAFFGEAKEDVVLAREIAVNRGRTVFDALGDFSNRDVLEALTDE